MDANRASQLSGIWEWELSAPELIPQENTEMQILYVQ